MASSSRARSRCRLVKERPRAVRTAAGNIETQSQGAVVQVADERLLFLVAGTGQVDQGARVGGNDHADAARQAQAQGNVILGRRVLDPGHAGRDTIEPAHQAFLHRGRQAGNAAARDAGLGAELIPVAGHLHDGPQRTAWWSRRSTGPRCSSRADNRPGTGA